MVLGFLFFFESGSRGLPRGLGGVLGVVLGGWSGLYGWSPFSEEKGSFRSLS